jgi:tetratricopeptide (TPR) repeat protein
MSDPLRSDSPRLPEATSVAEAVVRDAKIEQLLLAGLDHYFAAQYEQAINVWTRALFLDRSHARARAYIERARSALAERQRESEELLHKGVAALERGEIDTARQLVQKAIDDGAPFDEALPVLERVNRLDAAPVVRVAPRKRRLRRLAAPAVVDEPARSHLTAIVSAVGVTAALAVGAFLIASRDNWQWPSWLGASNAPVATTPSARSLTLAPPRRGEMALMRARELAASGYLHDALSLLDRVRPTDAEHADADRLRADIQRQLLRLAADGLP